LSTAPEFIGEPDKEVEVVAFRGGQLDALMYLGVVHAWLVHRRDPPHLVSGVSTGAIAAAAMAKVLGKETLEERTAKLREFLIASVQAPGQLFQSLPPDPYEVEAQHPLRSLEQPSHLRQEREKRDEALTSRAGIINLLNDVLGIRLTIGKATRLVRASLGYTAAADHERLAVRIARRVWPVVQMWWLLVLYTPALAPLLALLVGRAIQGWVRKTFATRPPTLTAGRALSLARKSGRWLRRLLRGVVAIWLYVAAVWLPGLWVIAVLAAPFAIGCQCLGWRDVLQGLAIITSFSLLPQVAALVAVRSTRTPIRRLVLGSYDLVDELGSSYDLRRLLIQLFDPGYFGRPELKPVLERAIARDRAPSDPDDREVAEGQLKLHKLRKDGRLHVAPAAAQLRTGKLTLIPDVESTRDANGKFVTTDVSLVDALLASIAVSPFLKPVKLTYEGESYHHIDGINVANEPITAVMEYLRARVNPKASRITVHAVSPFPSKGWPLPHVGLYTGLVGVVQRVLQLQRLQVATLERQLTDAYSRAVSTRNASGTIVKPDHVLFPDQNPPEGGPFLWADIKPIDASRPLDVGKRLVAAVTEGEREQIALEAVAEGCRATLLTFTNGNGKAPEPLPGNDPGAGPGLVEVCRRCAVSGVCTVSAAGQPAVAAPAAVPSITVSTSPEPAPPPEPPEEATTPWTALVLSGGVFRGVFQIGMLVGVSEAGLAPKLLVGSSVGSLVATMAARIFSCTSADDQHLDIARVAQIFLGLDQLVMTDRLADFVRRLTLRAGDTRMSPRDLDWIFRRYDRGRTDPFLRTARRVVGGLERLLYLTPYEQADLARLIRLELWNRVDKKARVAAQYFLDRSGVGFEALGAENLLWLIAKLALPELSEAKVLDARLNHFAPACHLLVTATNLQQGKLHLFGMEAARGEPVNERLIDTLLASSAFPGVFRPRHYSEVIQNEPFAEQFTDGGVMDNLPLYGAAQFFAAAHDHAGKPGSEGPLHARAIRSPRVRLDANGRRVAANGPGSDVRVPHLLIPGSLEPERFPLEPEEEERLAQDWVNVRNEAACIAFNQKVATFAKAQRDFRALHAAPRANGTAWEPVDLHVATVKARWLCGSFAFHPMLGFERRRQAQSIAHGCAMTIARLWRAGHDHPTWKAGWGLGLDDVDRATLPKPGDCPDEDTAALLKPASRSGGGCWFRTRSVCPFSKQALAALNARLEPERRLDPQVVTALDRIYVECGKRSTHRNAQLSVARKAEREGEYT
jgi:predicted acylesterase/phospholipase RssA